MNVKRMTVVLSLGICALGVSAHEIAVSPSGVSPQEALAKIRAARAAGDKDTWTVRVSGRNRLAETLVFTPDDHDIAFVGEKGAEFSGGVTLTGWTDTGKGWFETAIPKSADGRPIYFEQLWVNGRRADRARYPNGTGFSRVKRPSITEDPNATGSKRFIERVTFADGTEKILAQLPADEMPYAQLCVVHKWNFARRIIRGFDAKTGTLEVRGPAAWTWWQGWNEGETLVCLENVRAAFDAAGEWFYDQKNGKVLYRPLPGEALASLDAVAPVGGLSSIVRFDGDYKGGRFISNISFKGILFGHSAATRPQVYKVDPKVAIDKYGWGPTETWQYQAAIQCDGAIYLCGVKGVRFDGCSFAHTGNYALRFASGCTTCEVTNCRLYDLGAGGIWMGSELDCRGNGCEIRRQILPPNRPDSTAHNLISNCVITAAGKFNPEATGVIIGHCSDTKVVHNDIYDILYTGISVGWVWGYAGSVAQRNEIAWNRIYDLGKGIMSDMGGVYTLGTSFGTRVHHNEIHDVRSFTYGGWALYCDEGSEGVTMDHNVCWNTTDGGFHQHYGVDNTIRNNIFAFNRDHAVVRISRVERDGVPSTLNFLDNIVYTTTGDLMAGWDGANDIGPIGGVFANNLWYRPDGGKISGKSWADWAASGRESGGAWGDPRFVDAAKFDFRLRPDSPAPKTGFMPFDLAGVGVEVTLTGDEALPFERDGVRFAAHPTVLWRAGDGFKFAREPLLARMKDGSLVCMLYTGGEREPDTNNVVALVRSVDDGATWSKPEVVFSHPHRACWATELNTLGERPELVFQTFDAHTHYADLRPWRCWTDDGGKTWTKPVAFVGVPPCFTARQGLRLADGALVYPIYWQECKGDFKGWVSYGPAGSNWTTWGREGPWWFASGAIRSEDNGATWSFAAVPQAELRGGRPLNQWEPAIVELKPGELKMFVRVESDERVLWESESSDGGRTWTRLHPGAISNPGTKMQVLKRGDEVVLFNNVCDSKRPNRYRLEVAISGDGCRTWRHIALADSTSSAGSFADWFNGAHVQVAYPSAVLDEARRTCYLVIDSIGTFYLLKIPYAAFGWNLL